LAQKPHHLEEIETQAFQDRYGAKALTV